MQAVELTRNQNSASYRENSNTNHEQQVLEQVRSCTELARMEKVVTILDVASRAGMRRHHLSQATKHKEAA
eukprot:1272916-Amphidinium_carterae.1